MFKNIREEIDAVFDRDPAAKSRLEVLLCYPGFHAVIVHRLSHKLWEKNWLLAARFLSQVMRFFTGIEIHPGATIGKRFFIDHGMGVVIGETATIGDDVTIYHGVTLGGTSLHEGIRHPQLGNKIIVGAGAQLLGPIKLGDGARIGSNAVVLKDVPEGATMVGIPARLVSGAKAVDVNHFDAYGTPQGEVQDPLLKAVELLQQQVVELQNQRVAVKAAAQDKIEETQP